MAAMGRQGWELVTVQPLLKGIYAKGNAQVGFGYSLTAGYYFFWKKGNQ
jgi:hypothetical protein